MKHRNFIFAFVMAIFLIASGCGSTTPLIKASAKGDSLVVQNLINQGANINEPDSNGSTPLMHAIWEGKTEVAKTLVESGANVNATDKEGNTSIIFAANLCNGKMMKLLADNRAKVNVKNIYGETPLHCLASSCLSYGDEMAAVVEYLLEKGCDLKAVNKRGKTAYAVAIEYMNMEMIAALRRKGVTESFQDPAGAMHEGLRRPSFYKPSASVYTVPPDRLIYFELAIEDCNHYSVPYKKGWLFGPIVYGAELAVDKNRGTEKFNGCMKIMGLRKNK